MKSYRLLACAGVIMLSVAIGCASPEPAADSTEPAPSASMPAPAATAPAGESDTAPAKFVSPVRGTAELGILKPVTKRTGNEIVTVFQVKNLSTTNSIVGLKVEDYWYDKGGNPVTGDQYRHRQPLLPEETLEVTLRTPMNPAMDRNQYKFEHANGAVNPKTMPKF